MENFFYGPSGGDSPFVWCIYALVLLIALVGSPVGTVVYLPIALTRHIVYNVTRGRAWYASFSDFTRSFIGCSFIFLSVLFACIQASVFANVSDRFMRTNPYADYYGMGYMNRTALDAAARKRKARDSKRIAVKKTTS